ncbi:hypothetical protein [Kitasatospora sp. NPDC008115]|uniref:hypothetical protein n=1 Tax=Kitasatospora sp. NPDC008115 TaxID=3364022 RepID=UPI0036E0DDE0
MTETTAHAVPSRHRDLLLALVTLPLVGGVTALMGFAAFAVLLGMAMSDASEPLMLLASLGLVLPLAPAVVVARLTWRAGRRLTPLAALLAPFTALLWFQLPV